VTSNTVLTAAHCETLVLLFRAVLAEHDVTQEDGQMSLPPLQWVNHPNYDSRSSKFDVALVRIPSVKFSERISPVCLPSPTQEYEQREVRSVIQTVQTQT